MAGKKKPQFGPFSTDAVFTTGQIAKLCKVAPRTVSIWFDTGRLKGYRVPGGQDRRIPRENLIQFLKDHGLPLGDLERDCGFRVLHVGTGETYAAGIASELTADHGFVHDFATNAFTAGQMAQRSKPNAVVMDFQIGTFFAKTIAGSLPDTPAVGIVGDDFGAETLDGFARLVSPGHAAQVAQAVREFAARKITPPVIARSGRRRELRQKAGGAA